MKGKVEELAVRRDLIGLVSLVAWRRQNNFGRRILACTVECEIMLRYVSQTELLVLGIRISDRL